MAILVEVLLTSTPALDGAQTGLIRDRVGATIPGAYPGETSGVSAGSAEFLGAYPGVSPGAFFFTSGVHADIVLLRGFVVDKR